jgi:hypothetical protein
MFGVTKPSAGTWTCMYIGIGTLILIILILIFVF